MTQNIKRTRRSFLYNIVLPSALAVLLFVATLFLIVIPSFEKAMMDRKREMIRELTNAATSILEKYHRDETEGVLTGEEARKTAISRIRYLRYGEENKDYFWITDTIPVMVMHPYREELNGQNLSGYKDPRGKKLFVESVKIARKEDHGYVDYMWQWKDDSSHIVPKLSYVRAFKPWGWIIGTGIYIEDVKKEIAGLTNSFVRISILISLITALILFYIGRQSFRIENKRIRAEEALVQSREKYRSLVEASTEGLMMVAGDRIIFSNNILLEMAGLPESEVLLRSPQSLLKIPEGITGIFDPYENTDFSAPFEAELKRGDGTALQVLVNLSQVLFNEQPTLILSLRDLSPGARFSGDMVHTVEDFKALTHTLKLGVFRATMDPRGRFLEANTIALNILGYNTIKELSETYILEMFTDIDDKRGFRNQLLRQGFLKNQVLKLKRKNGQPALVNVSLVVIDGTESSLLCDGIIEDINPGFKDTALSEALAEEYSFFSQLLFQPVKTMMKPPVKAMYYEPIEEVAARMTRHQISSVLVCGENGEALGIITDQDLRGRAFSAGKLGKTGIFEIMSSPLITAGEECLVMEALTLMNRHDISHLVITGADGQPTGFFRFRQLGEILDAFPAMAAMPGPDAISLSDLSGYHARYSRAILPLIENLQSPDTVFYSLSILSDHITRNIVEQVLTEMSPPPSRFCFFSLGSEARREQTLKTDQDNALIFEDVPEDRLEAAQQWFARFSQQVCTALNEAGYSFCLGNIMAMNPEYCQPASVWQRYFHRWINQASAKDLLDINIFFDIRAVYGDTSLVTELQQYIFDLTDANPAYLYHLAQNTLQMKPQVGFWGNILLETAGAPPETVHIKEAIMPVVNFARIYALKHGIAAPGTRNRLKILQEQNILTASTCTNTLQAFEHLNLLRLKHQAYLLKQGLKPDNLINTKTLSELDKTIIKKVISNINNLIAKLSFDFKGSY